MAKVHIEAPHKIELPINIGRHPTYLTNGNERAARAMLHSP
jgi:hypothetical protein